MVYLMLVGIYIPIDIYNYYRKSIRHLKNLRHYFSKTGLCFCEINRVLNQKLYFV